MNNNWKKYKLDEIADYINRGVSPSYSDRGVPVINQKCIRDGKILRNDIKFHDLEKRKVAEEKYLKSYDILICSTGTGTLGRVGQIKNVDSNQICDSHVTIVRPGVLTDEKFLGWQLKLLQPVIEALAEGSTGQTELGRDKVKNLDIILPPLPEQKAIAEILSALDDKIELNLQTNKTLEDMANALYKHWFVDFGPFKNGEFVESELGMIPVGWEVKKIGEVFKTTSGGTPSRSKMEYYKNGIIQWVKSKELNGSFIIDTEERITDVALKNSSAKILPPKTVLLAMYGATVGEIGIISNEATCNQAICAIISSELSYTYIFQYLKNNKQNILNNAVGSAQQNISQEIIKDFPIIVPNITQVKEVMYKCELFFEQVELNVIENLHLKQTRDYLLPKLISGEIRVKEAIKKVKDLV